ncbi:MAG: deoxyguanosinetriphosphate triphosphohydrolase [Chloroflexota bacterium]|nr:deoxyguanosinetriphosphate triphosphohydrolase [Chloroflexota bacterium]
MHSHRLKLEDNELATLAPYALFSRLSRGRLHNESEPRYRTAFQRDRDRIVHSAAFRLLEYKTQVFVNDAGDYYRTRLTHTLEVAQIGRTLARALGANEDLVEAICLAHDLGHPPFGHAGEDALNQLMSDHGGFNHNHQSYRVVTQLERRYPRWSGLNLTFETLEGIAKHETAYDRSAFRAISEESGPGLEAQIANVADELAYNAHDLDDGLQSGLIHLSQLQVLDIWRRVVERVKWDQGDLDDVSRHNIIRELVGQLVDDVLFESERRIEDLAPRDSQDIQDHPQPVVSHSDEQQALNAALKDFLFHNMYRHFRIVRMQTRAEHIIQALFDSYIGEPRQLPDSYRAKLDSEPKRRVVADYIASLTDRSALREFRQLFDPVSRP